MQESMDQKKLCIWTLFMQCGLRRIFWNFGSRSTILFTVLLVAGNTLESLTQNLKPSQGAFA